MIDTAFEEKFGRFMPMPFLVVNSNGKIVRFNERIKEVFPFDELTGYDFFALTGIHFDEIKEAAKEEIFQSISRNERDFRVFASLDPDDEDGNVFVYFYEITRYTEIQKKYDNERICVARVDIDNYDDLISNIEPAMRMTISSQVDKDIRDWSDSIKASIVTVRAGQYIMYFQHRYLKGMTDSKFEILDKVREIETQTDFPISLSIGVGINGETLSETRNYADAALDLALGRGGDQAIIRDGNKIKYYGGRMMSVEKGFKGKSRVVAHALKRLIEQSERVLIMAHRNADMDAFGAELGMARICQIYGKNASIIMGNVNDSLNLLYKQAKATGVYNFIDPEKAKAIMTPFSLIVLLDTHRPSYSECEEILSMTERVAVIDHHRRAADGVENPVLSYIESYASSTSELVTEILQYLGAKKPLTRLEAEALLAGMMVDTNRFAVKTGGRTFEAAAWLKRAGADTAEVKRLFQVDADDFKVRSKAIAECSIKDGIATSICEGENKEAQIVNSQVADELMNIRGVKVSFVAGYNSEGDTFVSARSIGDVNVQIIMEEIGGGGHLTTAGAQVKESPEEILKIVAEKAKEQLERTE